MSSSDLHPVLLMCAPPEGCAQGQAKFAGKHALQQVAQTERYM